MTITQLWVTFTYLREIEIVSFLKYDKKYKVIFFKSLFRKIGPQRYH